MSGRYRYRIALSRHAVLIAFALVMTLPIVWVVLSSFKANEEIFRLPFRWFPERWHFDNYVAPFSERPLHLYFLNSILVAVVVTASNLLFDAMVGYALAQFRFPGRTALFFFIIGTMMLPVQVIIIPLFLIVQSFGWLNSYLALIVPGCMSAFGVFLMRQWFLGFPRELLDAARIDGASEPGIFFRIVMPTAWPALSALAIFIFMANYDSYLWPLVAVNREELTTLPIGIAAFVGEYQTAYNQLMAVSVLSLIPVLIVFLIFQKRFVQGMVTSGVKG
jgi:ABC-type glycerol-3-phosphate transport system permease component